MVDRTADLIEPAPMSEPEVVSCRFIEGVEIELRPEFVRIVGWIFLEVNEESAAPEKRIVLRAAMRISVARELIRDLKRRLARGGN